MIKARGEILDKMNIQNQAIIYNDGEIELNISVEKETIWLRSEDLALLFDVNRPAIVKHIGNIYKPDELAATSTCSILEQVAKDGKKRKIKYYNLDIVISVGYRVNSKKATQFRKWATQVLKQYVFDGYAINGDKITHERFKELEKSVHALQNRLDFLEDKTIMPSQGIFYNGEIFDAYKFISDLIKSGKEEIVLIDNYIDESILTLFSKNQNIQTTIYTKTITKQLKLDLQKYNAQYRPITIKTFKNSHDRFLIIDKKEVYHIGASLKDLGKKWFAFSKMDAESLAILEKLGIKKR
jgi:prophage antirepressor-like protein